MAVNKSDPAALEYAKALMLVGQEKKCLGAVFDDLQAIDGAYREDKVFKNFFTSPKISKDVKLEIVEKALGDKLHEMTKSFLSLLIHKRREPLLDNIVDAFQKYRDQNENKVHVWVESALALDESQRSSLISQIGSATGKEVVMHEVVDASLIGGMRIRIGDKLLDTTIKRRIGELSHTLLDRESALTTSVKKKDVDELFEKSKAAVAAG